ncbi:MAG: T9SS type A sorting domain-containing protein, partial [Fidelibacterota bacterium]
DVWLVKFDSSGTQEWNRTYGGGGRETARCVQQTTDGGYVIVGETYSFGGGAQCWVIKTDSLGTEEWSQTFGGSDADYGMSVQQTADGGFIIAGTTQSFGTDDEDVWLIKLQPWTGEVQEVIWSAAGLADYALHQNYPNPFNASTTIHYGLPEPGPVSLAVYDLLGRQVTRLLDTTLGAGHYEMIWEGTSLAGKALPSGIYLVRLVAPGYTRTIKVLLTK